MNENWDLERGEKVKVIAALLVITAVALIGGCSAINNMVGLPDDHEGEEILEQVVEQYTGFDLDLSPGSCER